VRKPVPELELLQAVERGGPEPSVEVGVAAAPAAPTEGEAADGAAVRREDAGDDVAAGHPPGDVVVAEVERGGAPEVAPPRGQGLRARAVAGGEVGDDGGECGVREAADEVGPGLRQLLLVPAPGAAAVASSLGRYPRFLGWTSRRH